MATSLDPMSPVPPMTTIFMVCLHYCVCSTHEEPSTLHIDSHHCFDVYVSVPQPIFSPEPIVEVVAILPTPALALVNLILISGWITLRTAHSSRNPPQKAACNSARSVPRNRAQSCRTWFPAWP